MTVPYTFGTATTSIPLSNLDANFNTPITLGNTSIYLGNTTTTIGNLTLTNATISSGSIANITITNVSVTSANITTLTSSSITDTGLTSGRVTIAGTGGLLTDSANLVFTGSNLGIGVSNPTQLLQLGNATAVEFDMFVGATRTGTFYVDNSQMIITAPTAINMYFKTADTTRLTIGGNGNIFTASGVNVGIGTSSPAEQLDVAGNIRLTGNQNLIFQQASGVAVGTISFRNSSSVQKAAIASYYNVADEGNIEFLNGGTSSMILASAGNLLLGTPTQRNAAKFTLSYNGSTNNGIAIIETATASGTEFITFLNPAATNIANISRVGTTDAVSYNTTSSNTTGAQLNASGVRFPATQVASADANTLDDYEEGTWTPNQGNCTVVGTFSSAGTYTKVGRLVTVNIAVKGSTSITCAAGGSVTTNLPFPVLADTIGSYSTGKEETTSTVLTLLAYASVVFTTNNSGVGTGLYMTMTYMEA
jgi:hypothetical protein